MSLSIRHSTFAIRHFYTAFSLIEMMIAIVILGLGLVMVATMFPVAWDRARTLSEHTTEETIASAAHARLQATLRPAGLKLEMVLPSPALPPFEEPRIAGGSFAGDLFYDQKTARDFLAVASAADEAYQGIIPSFCDGPLLFYSDTRVHALNMENLNADELTEVAENPWELEWIHNFVTDGHPCGSGYSVHVADEFVNRTGFFRPQVFIADRVQPGLEARPRSLPAELAKRNNWNDRFLSRKYSWAVLHRLREPVGPAAPLTLPANAADSRALESPASEAIGSTRNFDLYYVTVRRAQSTHRFALQDHSRASNAFPNPFVLDRDAPAAIPSALDKEFDVVLPTPWRIQVQFPDALALRNQPPAGSPLPTPTGIPTEVTVPADPAALSGDQAALVVSAFPTGTTFVDEISGAIYRVVKRRVLLGTTGSQSAVLTLDREVVLEDVDLPLNDRRCSACLPVNPVTPTVPAADPEELLRTVWVYPPPVNRSAGDDRPVFDGASPVVGIRIRPLSVSPAS